MRMEPLAVDLDSARACHECDLVQQLPKLSSGESARCLRCNALLKHHHARSLQRSLALTLTGLILFVVANMFPLISLSALGNSQQGTLFSATMALMSEDMHLLGILILFTTILFPLFSLLGTLYVLSMIYFDRMTPDLAPLFRFLRSTDAWGMLEIFLLALLVSVVKLVDITEVSVGISLYAFCSLIIVMGTLSFTLNPDDVWDHLRRKV